MNKVIIAAVAIVIVLGLIFVGSKAMNKSSQQPSTSSSSSEATSPTQSESMKAEASPTAEVSGGAMQGATKEFTVTGSSFKFEPATITVKKGDKVKLTFKNAGGFHNFVIGEFNVATKQIQSGAEETVEFTADRAGTFKYYCSVDGHRAQGMEGTIMVQ